MAIEVVEHRIVLEPPSEERLNKKYEPLKNKDTTFVKSSDLVDAVLEIIALIPDSAEWSEEAQKINPPRLYRLRMIYAMFDAFGLNKNGNMTINGFLQGDFIKDNKPYKQLLDEMELSYQSSSRFRETLIGYFNSSRDSIDIKNLYSYLFNFIREIDKLGHNQGMIGGDAVVTSFAYTLTRSGLKSMDPKILSDIRRVIETIIDPKQQEITIRDLVENHNYPDLDINEVSADFY